MNTITPKICELISRCVEEGIQYGYNRAHKHTTTPDEISLKDNIHTGVMNEICEWFDFPQNKDDNE